jgi:transposase-like protein
MRKTRRLFRSELKDQVTQELLREEHTVNELTPKHRISPALIGRWKAEFLQTAPEVIRTGSSDAENEVAEQAEHVMDLERKVGQLTIEALSIELNQSGNRRAELLK